MDTGLFELGGSSEDLRAGGSHEAAAEQRGRGDRGFAVAVGGVKCPGRGFERVPGTGDCRRGGVLVQLCGKVMSTTCGNTVVG